MPVFSSQLEINHVIQEPTKAFRTHVDHLDDDDEKSCLFPTNHAIKKWGKLRQQSVYLHATKTKLLTDFHMGWAKSLPKIQILFANPYSQP